MKKYQEEKLYDEICEENEHLCEYCTFYSVYGCQCPQNVVNEDMSDRVRA